MYFSSQVTLQLENLEIDSQFGLDQEHRTMSKAHAVLRYLIAGDSAVTVEFDNAISPDINVRVRQMALAVEHAKIEGIVEVVPAYRSLTVFFDPLRVSQETLQKAFSRFECEHDAIELPPPRTFEIPVFYGGTYGRHMDFVAARAGLTVEQVIALHSTPSYLVYMIGFTPGFPYFGGLPKELTVPRLETPRLKVPAGSVGIAGEQTGIYPSETTGGWRIIGWTPTKLFDPNVEPPSLLRAGDIVKFQPQAGV